MITASVMKDLMIVPHMYREETSSETVTAGANNNHKKYENVLLKQEVDYMSKFRYESSKFYGFPKIHKSNIIS